MSQYTSKCEIGSLKREVWAAARDGHASRIVDLLSNVGSHVEDILNHKTKEDGSLTTPLICAARHNNIGVVAVLLNFGVDLEQKGTVRYKNHTFHGVTALWCASSWSYYNIVKILVDHGANVNNSSEDGSGPLKRSCYHGELETAQCLVKHGADINSADRHGNTCLMGACYSGKYEVVKYLLKNRADPLRKNVDGLTALHFSAARGSVAISSLLVQTGLTLMKDNGGRTPLMLAALQGKIGVVEYFIAFGECSREDHVDALDLLGTSFLFKRNPDIVKAYDYYNTAMYERYKIKDKLVSKHRNSTSSILAITEKEECTTLDELEDIREDELALCIEGIHIRERVLGTMNTDLPLALFHTGSLFAGNGEYEKCIDLWTYASNLGQNIGVNFDWSRFPELFAKMLHDGLTINFKTVLTCFRNAENELNSNKIQIRVHSSKGKYEDVYERDILTCKKYESMKYEEVYERDILTCIYLVGILLQIFTSKEEENQLNRAVYSFIHTNPRLQNGYTPLHMCCDNATNNNDINMKNEILFPNIRLCKTLLACGANVNAQDGNNNTPLHVFAKCDIYDSNILCEMISCLLENGAHLDACNKEGETAADAATNIIAASIIKTHMHSSLLSLKCSSARAVRKYKIEFEGIIPDSLKKFAELH